jgi:hypothetical protein
MNNTDLHISRLARARLRARKPPDKPRLLCSLTAASANVATSIGEASNGFHHHNSDGMVGLGITGRMAMLEKLFHDDGVDIVGVQEGRFGTEQVINGMHYRIHAAAAAGATKALGVQLWCTSGCYTPSMLLRSSIPG